MNIKKNTTFTSWQAKEIKDLLLKIRSSKRESQKEYRGILRKQYGFYISMFTTSKKGFTSSDFDLFVKNQAITIEDPILKVK